VISKALKSPRPKRPTTSLLEELCNQDDELGMMFLEEKPISIQDVKAGLRRAVIANKIIPMAGGSAFKNKGVQYLIDAGHRLPARSARHSCRQGHQS